MIFVNSIVIKEHVDHEPL